MLSTCFVCRDRVNCERVADNKAIVFETMIMWTESIPSGVILSPGPW